MTTNDHTNTSTDTDLQTDIDGGARRSARRGWVATLVAGAAVGALAVGASTFVGGSPGAASAGGRQAVVAPPTSTGDASRTITVVGHGSVTVKPDTASLSLGVSVVGTTANGALRETATKTTALIKALKAAGVADDDIVTDGVSLYPQYDDEGKTVTGYNSSNNVTATIHQISTVGAVIDSAATLVGDEVTIAGVSFSLSADSDALKQARTAAIDDAAARAEDLAGAAGASVGQILTIDESSSADQPYPVAYSAGSAGDGSATPIQSGTQDVTVDVTVTYELQ